MSKFCALMTIISINYVITFLMGCSNPQPTSLRSNDSQDDDGSVSKPGAALGEFGDCDCIVGESPSYFGRDDLLGKCYYYTCSSFRQDYSDKRCYPNGPYNGIYNRTPADDSDCKKAEEFSLADCLSECNSLAEGSPDLYQACVNSCYAGEWPYSSPLEGESAESGTVGLPCQETGGKCAGLKDGDTCDDIIFGKGICKRISPDEANCNCEPITK